MTNYVYHIEGDDFYALFNHHLLGEIEQCFGVDSISTDFDAWILKSIAVTTSLGFSLEISLDLRDLYFSSTITFIVSGKERMVPLGSIVAMPREGSVPRPSGSIGSGSDIIHRLECVKIYINLYKHEILDWVENRKRIGQKLIDEKDD